MHVNYKYVTGPNAVLDPNGAFDLGKLLALGYTDALLVIGQMFEVDDSVTESSALSMLGYQLAKEAGYYDVSLTATDMMDTCKHSTSCTDLLLDTNIVHSYKTREQKLADSGCFSQLKATSLTTVVSPLPIATPLSPGWC